MAVDREGGCLTGTPQQWLIKALVPILQQQRSGEGLRGAEGAQPHVGPRGLSGRQGLYLRTDPVLLLQLRQHSRVICSGVRGRRVWEL